MRGALVWGVAGAAVASLAIWPVRGTDAAVSVLLAGGLVLANAAASAAISVLAGKVSSTGSAMIALPSFAVRMSLMFLALIALDGRPFIDEPVFALSFCGALTLVLLMEARGFKRTPWIALTFQSKEHA